MKEERRKKKRNNCNSSLKKWNQKINEKLKVIVNNHKKLTTANYNQNVKRERK